jgi:tetratricopeptide (TPR) repeat protein
MSPAKRRTLLYGVCVVLGAGLLVAGFGITVPADAGTQLSGAAILARLGDTDGALAACDQVIADDPECLDAHIYRATFLAMAGRNDESVRAYDEALRRVDTAELRLDLIQDRASVLLAAGRVDDFDRAFAEMQAKGGPDRVRLLDGIRAAHDKEWARAVNAFADLLQRSPGDERIKARLWHAHMERGREAVAGGSFGEAKQSFDAAASLIPKAAEAHLQAAEVRFAIGEVGDGLAIVRELGPKTPGIAPLVHRAAVALLAKGDREGALDALDAAYSVDPAGTKTLVEKEEAWKAIADDPVVRHVLETDLSETGTRLTAPERVIDTDGTAGSH